jgi:hypothetical protein
MSTPTSTAREDSEPIRSAVAAALNRHPVVDDPTMADLRRARVGEPVLARSPGGVPAFWIVPLEAGTRVPGFARVELDRRVAQIGRLGASADDPSTWSGAAFFRGPAETTLNEIRARHQTAALSQPELSYDGSPAKWAWLVKVGEPATRFIFITAGGWYERPAEQDTDSGREG